MTRLFEAKPFIIAEVGSNWRDLNDCIQSIGQAKAVGADAVKFQAFNWTALYGVEQRHWAKIPHELDVAWLPKLKEKADACHIELMCTAFSPELVEAVDPYVTVHKVASSDLSYPQLLEAVIKTRKPRIISVGASSQGDIMLAKSRSTDADWTQTVWMYCVAAYPARTIDLRVMDLIGKTYGFHGFSDHSTDIVGHPVEAARRGAVVLEKHFTAFPNVSTPDRPHSLTVDEFKTMVDYIRGIRQPVIGPTPEEKDMLLRHNRRLIATMEITTGDLLVYG